MVFGLGKKFQSFDDSISSGLGLLGSPVKSDNLLAKLGDSASSTDDEVDDEVEWKSSTGPNVLRRPSMDVGMPVLEAAEPRRGGRRRAHSSGDLDKAAAQSHSPRDTTPAIAEEQLEDEDSESLSPLQFEVPQPSNETKSVDQHATEATSCSPPEIGAEGGQGAENNEWQFSTAFSIVFGEEAPETETQAIVTENLEQKEIEIASGDQDKHDDHQDNHQDKPRRSSRRHHRSSHKHSQQRNKRDSISSLSSDENTNSKDFIEQSLDHESLNGAKNSTDRDSPRRRSRRRSSHNHSSRPKKEAIDSQEGTKDLEGEQKSLPRESGHRPHRKHSASHSRSRSKDNQSRETLNGDDSKHTPSRRKKGSTNTDTALSANDQKQSRCSKPVRKSRSSDTLPLPLKSNPADTDPRNRLRRSKSDDDLPKEIDTSKQKPRASQGRMAKKKFVALRPQRVESQDDQNVETSKESTAVEHSKESVETSKELVAEKAGRSPTRNLRKFTRSQNAVEKMILPNLDS